MIHGTVCGNIGGKVETRQVGGDTVTQFSVAVNRKNKDGSEATTWVRGSLWGKRGAAVEQYLSKGTAVTIVGELSLRSYESGGTTKTDLEMRVADLKLQGGKRDTEAPSAAAFAPLWAAPQRAPAPAFQASYDDEIPF